MKLLFTLILLFGSTQYVNNDISRKVISDDNYNYNFYVSNKNRSNYQNFKEYYWYKSGKIHSSYGGSNGQVLHGLYKKTYRENGIMEQGEFYYGLKDKTWKTWYKNGKINKIQNWQKGVTSGLYREHSESGELLNIGKYKNGKKHGKWINHKTSDTLYFKKGEKVVKEEIVEKKNEEKTENKSFIVKTKDFFKSVFKKKTPEEKEKIKKEKETDRKQKELEKKRKELVKKKNASKKL